MAKVISLMRKDMIKQGILIHKGEMNTVSKSTGKYNRLSVSSWVFYIVLDDWNKNYNTVVKNPENWGGCSGF